MLNRFKQEVHKLRLMHMQPAFLNGKDEQLDELMQLCDTKEQWRLIYKLLDKFKYVEYPQYGELLRSMANYINGVIEDNESNFCIMALTTGDEADSSQALIQDLKFPLHKSFEKGLCTCNNFGRLHKYHNEHPDTRFILVDEFCGSGKTLATRVRTLNAEEVDYKICMLAGMGAAIQKIRDLGADIHCCYEMQKGISEDEEMSEEEIERALRDMLELESKLATQINDTRLSDHSLGYGRAESLFAIENSNPPNNNFPIFWWKRYLDGTERKTLLNRVQHGY